MNEFLSGFLNHSTLPLETNCTFLHPHLPSPPLCSVIVAFYPQRLKLKGKTKFSGYVCKSLEKSKYILILFVRVKKYPIKILLLIENVIYGAFNLKL